MRFCIHRNTLIALFYCSLCVILSVANENSLKLLFQFCNVSLPRAFTLIRFTTVFSHKSRNERNITPLINSYIKIDEKLLGLKCIIVYRFKSNRLYILLRSPENIETQQNCSTIERTLFP